MKRHWEHEELVEHWTVDVEDRILLSNKTGATRLGFAVLLKFFQQEGRFPQQKNEVPGIVIAFLATQVGVAPEAYVQYAWQGRTIEYHRAQIREALGFRESTVEDADTVTAWLVERVLPREHHEERLRDMAYQRFRALQLEAPTPARITRITHSARHTFEQQLYDSTLARLPVEVQAALDALLTVDEREEAQEQDAQTITLEELRMDPGRVGLATVLQEMAKLRRIRDLSLPADLFPGIAHKVLAVYRNRASVEEPSRVCAHDTPMRLTLLAALCVLRSQELTDGLVDLLIQIVHKIQVRAENRVEQEYVTQLKRIAGKDTILYHIAEAAVEHPDDPVREVVFPVASETLLRDLIKEYQSKGPAFRRQVHTIIRASYSHHYRSMVPELLDILDFRSNNELYRPVIQAIQLVKDYVRSPRPLYPEEEVISIKEVVAPRWREFVVEKEADGTERVNRLNYEMCVLQALREKVRTKEIWVVGANRFRNPDDNLPTDFEQNRKTYYDALHQPHKADQFIEQVKTALQAALRSLDAAMPRLGKKVRLLPGRKKAISLTPLEAQPEPRNLIALKREVGECWSNTNLLDILKETALRTNFLDFLTSVASRERLPREVLHRRLLLCLYGLGTNTGFKRLPSADPGTIYSDLRYVRSRYIHKEACKCIFYDRIQRAV